MERRLFRKTFFRNARSPMGYPGKLSSTIRKPRRTNPTIHKPFMHFDVAHRPLLAFDYKKASFRCIIIPSSSSATSVCRNLVVYRNVIQISLKIYVNPQERPHDTKTYE